VDWRWQVSSQLELAAKVQAAEGREDSREVSCGHLREIVFFKHKQECMGVVISSLHPAPRYWVLPKRWSDGKQGVEGLRTAKPPYSDSEGAAESWMQKGVGWGSAVHLQGRLVADKKLLMQ